MPGLNASGNVEIRLRTVSEASTRFRRLHMPPVSASVSSRSEYVNRKQALSGDPAQSVQTASEFCTTQRAGHSELQKHNVQLSLLRMQPSVVEYWQ